MKHLTLVLACALALTGCMSREILSIEDGPPSGAGQTTVLTTYDVQKYFLFGVAKRVYWECSNTGSGLVCAQTCDVKDDEGDILACPTVTGAL